MYTNCLRGSFVALTLLLSTIVYAPAQTNFTVLKVFLNTNGAGPWGGVTLGDDNALYGATFGGSFSNAGTIYKINTNGTGFNVLYYMFNTTASNAYGKLVFGTNGTLYGTTIGGGVSNCGTVYRVNRDGTGFTILHHFLGGPDGKGPMVGLIRASDGFFYGTTDFADSATRGTVFKIDGNGNNYQVIHVFTGSPEGQQIKARVMESTNGMLYGTAAFGGTAGRGTVFQMDKTGGNYFTLHSFLGSGGGDGSGPNAGLLEASDGLLYGTTTSGGASNLGSVFKIAKDLSAYSIVYSFTATNNDGQSPFSELMESGDGALYGCTQSGGISGNGTVFKVNKDDGGYAVLRRFTGSGDGFYPKSGLIQGSNGVFYGATVFGGLYALSSNALPPRINSLVLSNSSNTLQCAGSSGVQYDVLRATNLLSPSWTNLATITAATNSLFTNVDLNPPSKGAFYRLQQH